MDMLNACAKNELGCALFHGCIYENIGFGLYKENKDDVKLGGREPLISLWTMYTYGKLQLNFSLLPKAETSGVIRLLAID